MEMGMGADHLGPRLQPKAALLLDRLQLIETLEVPIGQSLMRQGPQPPCRLPCGCIGGQDMPRRPHWPLHLWADMSTRAVEH